MSRLNTFTCLVSAGYPVWYSFGVSRGLILFDPVSGGGKKRKTDDSNDNRESKIKKDIPKEDYVQKVMSGEISETEALDDYRASNLYTTDIYCAVLKKYIVHNPELWLDNMIFDYECAKIVTDLTLAIINEEIENLETIVKGEGYWDVGESYDKMTDSEKKLYKLKEYKVYLNYSIWLVDYFDKIDNKTFSSKDLDHLCEFYLDFDTYRWIDKLKSIDPKIITSKAILYTRAFSIKNLLIEMKLKYQKKQIESTAEKSLYTTYKTLSEVPETTCKKYSLNQGNLGICYIISLITLFQNEATLLNKLINWVNTKEPKQSTNKIEQALYETVDILAQKYSTTQEFTACPKLPTLLQYETTGQSRNTRLSTAKKGGFTFNYLLYIVNMVKLCTDIKIKINVYDEYITNLEDLESELGVFNQSNPYTLFIYRSNIKFTNEFISILKLTPHLKGFILGVEAHVIAGSVCREKDRVSGEVVTKVYICNSWEDGCQETVPSKFMDENIEEIALLFTDSVS